KRKGNAFWCEGSKVRCQSPKKSAFFAQQTAKLVLLVTTQFELLTAVHHHAMMAAEPWLDLADALQIHDGGAMNAHEFGRVKSALHLSHVAAHQARGAIAVQAEVVSFRLNPVQVTHVEKQEAAFLGNRNPLDIFILPVELFEKRSQLARWRLLLAQFQGSTGMFHGVVKPLLGKWLEQIVEGVGFEGLHGIAVVGGDEDRDRHGVLADLPDDLETVRFGHLNIQKEEIGAPFANGGNGGRAVAALPGDREVGKGLEEFSDAAAGRGVIVDNQRGKLQGQTLRIPRG